MKDAYIVDNDGLVGEHILVFPRHRDVNSKVTRAQLATIVKARYPNS